ncbi:hypothetical protein PGIGA_G00004400 [Pangasianodon gigas]|uniref:Uncharacterized protein n=1 Tax=Pangasianodon gigas TaxID=30993 RepID=A0ACC5W673_PANGG|nr:hypothetical protein [Pangasianodon gigas]
MHTNFYNINKIILNILEMSQFLGATWNENSIIQKCLKFFELTNGPIIYKNGEVHEYVPNMELTITKETLCIILIIDYPKNRITNGLGCYYGYGHVLTALHVIEDVYNSEMLIFFSTGDTLLIYKSVFTKSCNTNVDQDQGFIKLLGNTSPLGDGLQNQIGKMNENENVYFYTSTPDGNFQKQEGKILRPNLNMKAQMCTEAFVISVAGKPGDSGSPVYNAKGELIGLYQGSFTCPGIPEYGHCSGISSRFLPWV